MPLIIPEGYAHVVYELQFDLDPEPMVVTCGHEIAFSSGGDFDMAADELFDRFATALGSVIPSTYDLTGVTVYAGTASGTPTVHVSTEAPVSGTGSGATLPQNCAYLIRKRTDLGGRRGRGRMYLPGVNSSWVGVDGSVNSTGVDTLNTAFANWRAALVTETNGTTLTPVVLHRSEGAGDEPPPTVVELFVCDDVIATQRQRLRP